MAGFDGNPFVARCIEPCQAQIVPSIEVGVLTMREPPTTLVVARTVGVRYVAIDVDGRELHVILIVERIGRVAAVARDAQAIAIFARAHNEIAVHGFPRIVVDVLHDDFQAGAVVGRQVAQNGVADPILTGRSAKTMPIFVPRAIEIDAAVVATLNRRPIANAMGQYWVLLPARCNHKQTGGILFNARAICGQFVDDRFVLFFHRFQLFHQTGCHLYFGGNMRLSRCVQFRIGFNLNEKREKHKRMGKISSSIGFLDV